MNMPKRVTIVEPFDISLSTNEYREETDGSSSTTTPVSQQSLVMTEGEPEVSDDDNKLVKVTFTDIIPLGFFIDYFEKFGDDDFVAAVDSIVREHSHLFYENDIFVRYIMENEPSLLINLEQITQKVKELQITAPILPRFFDVTEEILTAETMLFTLGPQINVSTRSDLVSRYIDEYKEKMGHFETDMLVQSKRLTVAIEEAAIRIEETHDAYEAFEENIIVGAVDPVTQRIPAEKWLQFMESWMKSARFIIERIRLNTSYMKTEYAQLKALHERKLELGESLTDTDFDDLRLRNANLARQIENMNHAMMQLKQSSGRSNLDLCMLRLQLLDLKNAEEKMHAKVANIEKERLSMLKEIAATTKDFASQKSEHEKVQHMIESCQAPEILEYVRVKQRQYELQKQHKVLCRQEHLMAMQTRTEERNLMAITRRKKVHPKWYEPYSSSHNDDESPQQLSNEDVPKFQSDLDLFDAINVKPIVSSPPATQIK